MISNGALKQLGFSEEDYLLQDDGAGVYIKEWYSETAQPSDSDINTAHTTFQAEYDQLNQFEMQFDDDRDGTTTWVDTINEIKGRHPK